ncbi:hypothetical protein Y032_0524g2918 [Ancylostoma ceylanicum]|uniref:Uncharacterized protein n=1 Tax=Ancylostoma ceylanicum TaxID=53326 RepID=A0A016WTP8_9BILA|nr:hypothetical protein Y032_0524g2918 [Ancylostoma ceylanicum]
MPGGWIADLRTTAPAEHLPGRLLLLQANPSPAKAGSTFACAPKLPTVPLLNCYTNWLWYILWCSDTDACDQPSNTTDSTAAHGMLQGAATIPRNSFKHTFACVSCIGNNEDLVDNTAGAFACNGTVYRTEENSLL